jgi:hypothetical protein
MKHEFAIKKETLFNGETYCTPLVRTRSLLTKGVWERITNVEGKLVAQNIDCGCSLQLTHAECEQRITDYKAQLESARSTQVSKVEILKVPQNGTTTTK